MIPALLVFACTYAVISGVRPPLVTLDRTSAALVGAVAMVLVGALGVGEALAAVHLQTIALLFGMMVLTACLVEARFFERLAWETIERAGTPKRLLWGVVLVGGGLSAVFVNDTICVMFTPLVVAVIEAAELPALPFLLALSTSTNIGGVATYTGNPQNMIVGTHAGIPFLAYFAHLFPVAAIGLLLDAALLVFLFRRELPNRPLRHLSGNRAAPEIDRGLTVKALLALGVAVLGFVTGRSLAGSALAAAALVLLIANRPPTRFLARVDYGLLVFFSSLFVVVEGVARAGFLRMATEWLVPHLGHTPAMQTATFSLATVLGSNLVSNVPFVLLGLDLVPRLLDPARGWLALAMASTLAGNLTLFGSVANLIVLELAGRHGRVGFLRFVAYGMPITLATTGVGVAILIGEAWLGW